MSKKSLIISLSLLSLLSLSLSANGCGDDSAEASLTKAEFVNRAGAICKEAENQQLQDASRYASENPGVDEEDLVPVAMIPPLEKALQEIKALGAPEGDEAELEAFAEEFESALEVGRQSPSALLRQPDNPFDKANQLAKEYGMTPCSYSP